MMTDESIENLYKLAENAHLGQFRFDGKTPYIEHIYAVERRVAHLGNMYRAVAIGHDLLEDTNVTALDLLNAGVHKDVVDAIVILTKIKGQDYDQYLILVKGNELARRVKIADMLSNLADSPTLKQIRKYAKGLLFLTE